MAKVHSKWPFNIICMHRNKDSKLTFLLPIFIPPKLFTTLFIRKLSILSGKSAKILPEIRDFKCLNGQGRVWRGVHRPHRWDDQPPGPQGRTGAQQEVRHLHRYIILTVANIF